MLFQTTPLTLVSNSQPLDSWYNMWIGPYTMLYVTYMYIQWIRIWKSKTHCVTCITQYVTTPSFFLALLHSTVLHHYVRCSWVVEQCNARVGLLNNTMQAFRCWTVQCDAMVEQWRSARAGPHCLLEEGGNYKHIHNFHLITYNSNTSYIAVVYIQVCNTWCIQCNTEQQCKAATL